MIYTGSAVATYVALMSAYMMGFSPLMFALFSAVLLCLWLSLYVICSTGKYFNSTEQALQSAAPELSESMAELHQLQIEINTLQSQFTEHANSRPISPDDSPE